MSVPSDGCSALTAYLLVTHGSPDVRPQLAIAQLAQRIHQRSHALIGTAVLECAPLPLHEQIRRFSQQATDRGIFQVQIVPLFLLPGVHVMEDVPREVEEARHLTTADLTLTAHLGSHAALKALLAQRSPKLADARILLSHGSRRPDGNVPVEKLAQQLDMLPAYWSVSPSLETRVQEGVSRGVRAIEIVPYFLFSGGITDAIAQSVDRLSQQFPTVDLHLAAPLDESNELANLVMNLMIERVLT
ncbi:sirohydrochlorin chelatase [Myxacorys almedinensis]|uniref:Sirohydrochlorin chelatase n=1 Tax=Myxacorys almedinensis A TaxID=2690445 RepID=A0A8J7Z5U1_9CYAN|nr:sirohydrochlorin chelatase [Myxacorys almedinensis]NDJ16020.1 sirohydrochlorin chelatase [Myxacorys almedinensis A]